MGTLTPQKCARFVLNLFLNLLSFLLFALLWAWLCLPNHLLTTLITSVFLNAEYSEQKALKIWHVELKWSGDCNKRKGTWIETQMHRCKPVFQLKQERQSPPTSGESWLQSEEIGLHFAFFTPHLPAQPGLLQADRSAHIGKRHLRPMPVVHAASKFPTQTMGELHNRCVPEPSILYGKSSQSVSFAATAKSFRGWG